MPPPWTYPDDQREGAPPFGFLPRTYVGNSLWFFLRWVLKACDWIGYPFLAVASSGKVCLEQPAQSIFSYCGPTCPAPVRPWVRHNRPFVASSPPLHVLFKEEVRVTRRAEGVPPDGKGTRNTSCVGLENPADVVIDVPRSTIPP